MRSAPFCRTDVVLPRHRQVGKLRFRAIWREGPSPLLLGQKNFGEFKRRSGHHRKNGYISLLQKLSGLSQVVTAVIIASIGDDDHGAMLICRFATGGIHS